MSWKAKEKRARSALALIQSGRWFTALDVANRLGLTNGSRVSHILHPLHRRGLLEAHIPKDGAAAHYRWIAS